ncbi:8223_t:CDS:2 [Funneliformis geosporum]|nr:8223_t:CDS:2 [Funneliformis geosporum]
MDNKFTSRKTLQKRRARENETQNERETHLVRNREYKQQKREKENAEENEARLERRTYLNNLNQNLNSQQRQLQQKTGQSNCGVNIRDKPSPADELSFPKAFVNFSSWAKYNESLSATEIYEQRYVRPLPNEGDIYVGSPWETGKTYVLEHITISDDVNLLVLSTRYSYSNTVTTRLNLKSYCDIDGNINLPDHKRVVCQIASLHRITNNLSIIAQAQSHLAGQSIEKKDVQGIIRALKTDFPELRIKEYHGKSDPVKKAHDFRNIEESWKDVDLVAYTSTLKIGVSCINSKFKQTFCIFNSYIETNAETNQMLFRMRGIFSDIDSIIRNKDVSTIRLWVAYMLEKFSSRCLFGWRMVDFLKEVGMIISIIESDPKSNKNTLLQVVKAKCSVVKTDKISDITNANILDRETAEFLENKSRKTLEEMCSLDQHHIVDCYGISPESLTEDFILKYGNFNHMK